MAVGTGAGVLIIACLCLTVASEDAKVDTCNADTGEGCALGSSILQVSQKKAKAECLGGKVEAAMAQAAASKAETFSRPDYSSQKEASKRAVEEHFQFLQAQECPANCAGGCMLWGECHTMTPDGEPATKELCDEVRGKWCPSAASFVPTPAPTSFVPTPAAFVPTPALAPVEPTRPTPGPITAPTPAPAPAPTPAPMATFCAAPSDFMAQNPLHQWCHIDEHPSAEDCAAAGCYTHVQNRDGTAFDFCDCQNKEACEGFGGTWNMRSCGEEVEQWSRFGLQAAVTAGSCDGVTTPWQQPLAEAIGHQAEKCCKNFPATLCDPTAKIMTPCSSDSEFEPANIMHSHCDFRGRFPDADACLAAGCHTWENDQGTIGCHCEEKAACEGFKATFVERTCGQEALHWDERGKNLKTAKTAGTCKDVKTCWGEDLTRAVVHPAKKCCKNFPATTCDPTAKKMTPCKDEADFEPDNVMHSWCDFQGKWPTAEACRAAKCHSWEEDGKARCHCDGSVACAALKGKYNERTCDKEISDWGEIRGVLQSAEANGTCANVKTPWGEDITRWLKHQARKCCKSFPKTVCDKTAKVMTPCATDADFEPNSIANKWCNYHGNEPSHFECEKKGYCHCHRKDACNYFNGTWSEETCNEWAMHWDEGGKGFKEAKKKGTCEGVTTSWGGNLKDESDHPAKWCCKSYPVTACRAAAES